MIQFTLTAFVLGESNPSSDLFRTRRVERGYSPLKNLAERAE